MRLKLKDFRQRNLEQQSIGCGANSRKQQHLPVQLPDKNAIENLYAVAVLF
jgi:hypothetical protein